VHTYSLISFKVICRLGPEFQATDPEVPGSIHGATTFPEKCGSGAGSSQPREYEGASGSDLERREYSRGDPPRDTLYSQKLALTSPTRGGRSVGIVRSRTKATEFIFNVV
jgi:hypothetical protein